MRSIARFSALVGLCISVVACSGDSPPEKADYMLQWYARSGTDYGDLIPGFKTLAMCRRAGAGKTIAELSEQQQLEWLADGPAAKSDNQPWFECQTGCRPHISNSYLLVCDHIASFQGSDALRPF